MLSSPRIRPAFSPPTYERQAKECSAILAKEHADSAADITAQERKVDELVYDIYGLSSQERDIIENDIQYRG